MASKKEYHQLADIFEKIHLIIMIVYILSLISLFIPSWRIYGSMYIVLVWLIELTDYGQCPITEEENRLRKKAGDKIKSKGFVNATFRRYLKFNFPVYAIDLLMIIAVIVSWIFVIKSLM